MQNVVQNWPACAELSSGDQVVQKWRKKIADFSEILFPSSALTTAAVCAEQFRVKLIIYFAEIGEKSI